MQEEIVLILQW